MSSACNECVTKEKYDDFCDSECEIGWLWKKIETLTAEHDALKAEAETLRKPKPLRCLRHKDGLCQECEICEVCFQETAEQGAEIFRLKAELESEKEEANYSLDKERVALLSLEDERVVVIKLEAEISRLKAELDQAIKAATDWQNKLTEQRDLYKSLAEKAREALKRWVDYMDEPSDSERLEGTEDETIALMREALSAFPAEGMKGNGVIKNG